MEKDKTFIQKKRHLKKLGYPVETLPPDKIVRLYPKAIISLGEKIKLLRSKEIPADQFTESEVELHYRRIIGLDNEKNEESFSDKLQKGRNITDQAVRQQACSSDNSG
jgi:hypothetical protein